jgi:putative CRISPR-associated protein (TIGR02619 family)
MNPVRRSGHDMQDSKPLYVLSPCGTSLLTNVAASGKRDDQRNVIFPNSNARQRQDIPSQDLPLLEDLLASAAVMLQKADPTQAATLSAELNSLLKIVGQEPPGSVGQNYYQLLCTDTWLGESTAKIIQQWLENKGYNTQIKRQTDLQTADSDAFQLALAELVRWFEEEMDSWQQQYRIIFNLTGGFKSVQGFLQTMASFYADETVYIFETGKDLIRIPRLPIRMEAPEVLIDQLEFFRCLDQEIPLPVPNEIPDILLMSVDGETCLSAWGELVWKRNQRDIYSKKVYASPYKKIRFGKQFLKSTRHLDGNRIFQVNRKIDDLCRFWHTRGTTTAWNPASLDFKELKGRKMLPSTHECDAWADQDAQRIFMHIEKEQQLVLDQLAPGLH